MEKTLTIIVPSYNAEAYLEKCLNSFWVEEESIRSQLEVIVVNDGSKDNTLEIARQFMHKDESIYRIIDKENGGHGSAINCGAEAASGRYMKVVDADDWVVTEKLSDLIQYLSEKNSDVIFCDYRTYDITTQEEKYYAGGTAELPENMTLEDVMQNWRQVQFGNMFHGIIYRTTFYRKTGYKVTEHVFYEDQEYTTMPCCQAESVSYYPGELYVYRIGDVNQSVAGQNQVRRLGDFEKVIYHMLEKKPVSLSTGGEAYWKKKTSMCITSYYEIALLKNAKKSAGRQMTKKINVAVKEMCPQMYQAVKWKYLVFCILSFMHVSSETYWKVSGMLKG